MKIDIEQTLRQTLIEEGYELDDLIIKQIVEAMHEKLDGVFDEELDKIDQYIRDIEGDD